MSLGESNNVVKWGNKDKGNICINNLIEYQPGFNYSITFGTNLSIY